MTFRWINWREVDLSSRSSCCCCCWCLIALIFVFILSSDVTSKSSLLAISDHYYSGIVILTCQPKMDFALIPFIDSRFVNSPFVSMEANPLIEFNLLNLLLLLFRPHRTTAGISSSSSHHHVCGINSIDNVNFFVFREKNIDDQ